MSFWSSRPARPGPQLLMLILEGFVPAGGLVSWGRGELKDRRPL